jgi:hypothetical protein
MEYFVGFVLALVVAGYAKIIGLDRGRSFYPTVLIVVAAYYPLFAAMGASGKILGLEVLAGLGFSVLATVGFQRNMWLVAGSIAGHGVFDLGHHLFIENPGVPIWWPGFCATADFVLGSWLAVYLWKEQRVLTGVGDAGKVPAVAFAGRGPAFAHRADGG